MGTESLSVMTREISTASGCSYLLFWQWHLLSEDSLSLWVCSRFIYRLSLNELIEVPECGNRKWSSDLSWPAIPSLCYMETSVCIAWVKQIIWDVLWVYMCTCVVSFPVLFTFLWLLLCKLADILSASVSESRIGEVQLQRNNYSSRVYLKKSNSNCNPRLIK